MSGVVAFIFDYICVAFKKGEEVLAFYGLLYNNLCCSLMAFTWATDKQDRPWHVSC